MAKGLKCKCLTYGRLIHYKDAIQEVQVEDSWGKLEFEGASEECHEPLVDILLRHDVLCFEVLT